LTVVVRIVASGVGVGRGVAVGVGSGVAVGVEPGVGLVGGPPSAVAVAVAVAVGAAVGAAVGVGDGDGLGVGDAVGFGVAVGAGPVPLGGVNGTTRTPAFCPSLDTRTSLWAPGDRDGIVTDPSKAPGTSRTPIPALPPWKSGSM
jgi:hypothetical protein